MSNNNRFDDFDTYRKDKNRFKNDSFNDGNKFSYDGFNSEDYGHKKNKNERSWSSVDDLIDGGNFDNIGEKVEKAVDFAVNEALNSVFLNSFGNSGKRFVRTMGKEAKRFVRNTSRPKGYEKRKYEISDFRGITNDKRYSKEIEKVINRPRGFAKTIALQVVFYFLEAFSLLGAIAVLVSNLVSPIWVAILFAISMVFMLGGILNTIRFSYINRFRNYLEFVGEEGFAYTEDISSRLRISQNKVVSDLKKMTDRKNFLEGHLIEDDSIFLITDKLYGYYLDGVSKREREGDLIVDKEGEELRSFIENCSVLGSQVRLLGEKINSSSMKDKASEISYLVETIIELVRENPSQLNVVSKFSTYYMPTTVKLFDSYYDLEKSNFESDQVDKSKSEIQSAIDSIIQAYRKILGEILSAGTMDINADISVLKSMLSQDGLTEDSPFNKKDR